MQRTLSRIAILCLLTACNPPHPEDGRDSYHLSERYQGDCGIYMMRFHSVKPFGCSFRVALSGPCENLTQDTFLIAYRSLLTENAPSIKEVSNSYFLIDAAYAFPLTDTGFQERLRKEATRTLGLSLSSVDTSDGLLRFVIHAKNARHRH